MLSCLRLFSPFLFFAAVFDLKIFLLHRDHLIYYKLLRGLTSLLRPQSVQLLPQTAINVTASLGLTGTQRWDRNSGNTSQYA